MAASTHQKGGRVHYHSAYLDNSPISSKRGMHGSDRDFRVMKDYFFNFATNHLCWYYNNNSFMFVRLDGNTRMITCLLSLSLSLPLSPFLLHPSLSPSLPLPPSSLSLSLPLPPSFLLPLSPSSYDNCSSGWSEASHPTSYNG